MTDIIRPNFGGQPTGYDGKDTTPTEAPDARHLRGDNLRPAKVPIYLVDGDVMARLGLNSASWPGMRVKPGPTRKELEEFRQLLHSLEEAAGQLEIAGRMIKTEARTLARRMGEFLDGEPEDFDPRGGAA